MQCPRRHAVIGISPETKEKWFHIFAGMPGENRQFIRLL